MKSTVSRRQGQPPGEPAPPPTVDLTSLVDVTFQLLVFLLVVNDLSARVQDDVALPPAHNATELAARDDVVTVNVLAPHQDHTSRVRIGGHDLDAAALRSALRAVADLHRPPTEPNAPSKAAVLIRADRAAPWQHVQGVLQECVRADVRITRIQFATEDPTATKKETHR